MTKPQPFDTAASPGARVIGLLHNSPGQADSAECDPAALRTDNRTAWTIGLLVMVLTAGAYLPSPLYPLYQRLFGYDDVVMTMLFAVFALVAGPALLLLGPAADAIGYRPVLQGSVLLAAASSACFLLADGPAWLFVGRAGQGIALGAATGAAQAIITLRRSPAARINGPLFASLTFVAGTAIGPFMAGMLAQYLPAPTMVPYLLHLAMLTVLWALLHRCEPGSSVTWHKVGSWRPTWPRVPRQIRGVFAVAGLSGWVAWCAVGIYLALAPTLLERVTQTHDPALAGGVLTGVLLWSLLAQLAATRTTVLIAQQLGVALLTGSLVLLAATGASWLPATLLAALLAGAGHGFAFSGAATAVEARIPASHSASVGGALYLFFYLGSAVPAVVVGALSTWLPLAGAVTWLSWFVAGMGAIALPLTRAVSPTTVASRAKTRRFPSRVMPRRATPPRRRVADRPPKRHPWRTRMRNREPARRQ